MFSLPVHVRAHAHFIAPEQIPVICYVVRENIGLINSKDQLVTDLVRKYSW